MTCPYVTRGASEYSSGMGAWPNERRRPRGRSGEGGRGSRARLQFLAEATADFDHIGPAVEGADPEEPFSCGAKSGARGDDDI